MIIIINGIYIFRREFVGLVLFSSIHWKNTFPLVENSSAGDILRRENYATFIRKSCVDKILSRVAHLHYFAPRNCLAMEKYKE